MQADRDAEGIVVETSIADLRKVEDQFFEFIICNFDQTVFSDERLSV